MMTLAQSKTLVLGRKRMFPVLEGKEVDTHAPLSEMSKTKWRVVSPYWAVETDNFEVARDAVILYKGECYTVTLVEPDIRLSFVRSHDQFRNKQLMANFLSRQ
jgi:hypothetical protein